MSYSMVPACPTSSHEEHSANSPADSPASHRGQPIHACPDLSLGDNQFRQVDSIWGCIFRDSSNLVNPKKSTRPAPVSATVTCSPGHHRPPEATTAGHHSCDGPLTHSFTYPLFPPCSLIVVFSAPVSSLCSHTRVHLRSAGTQ